MRPATRRPARGRASPRRAQAGRRRVPRSTARPRQTSPTPTEMLGGRSPTPTCGSSCAPSSTRRRRTAPSSKPRLKELLIPSDPNDGKNVIVEIRGAEGGEEANLWAGDLFHMYESYAKRHGWKLEVLSSQPSDMGGFRELTLVVKGDDAWARLKYEAGPHRVQRVPVTESQGRVHTSAATVAVLPEAEEVDVDIDPERSRGRRLPVERTRRSERQHHRLGGAHHAQADRSRRHVSGREEPAPEQGQGTAHPAVAADADRTREAGSRVVVRPAKPGEGRRSLREDPDLQLQGEPRDGSPRRA